MRVGVNYPWFDYGWDFGVGPPSWCGARSAPGWRADIDAHLRYFQQLGITVVRWFILADGLTYGAGAHAPVPDPTGRRWHFNPPPLSSKFVDDFAELLVRFAAANAEGRQAIHLIPVLVDFHFCGPGIRPVAQGTSGEDAAAIPDPGWVKGGRAEALADPVKRTSFLNEVLEPLLDVSSHHAEVIYAWELINEPEWVTARWRVNAAAPVPRAAMRAFIEEGHRRIQRAGFSATVGFASPDTRRRWRVEPGLPQFHHYPGGQRLLHGHSAGEVPGIVGEFATAATDVWPDLRPGDQSILHRLRRAREQGYALAIPWSFRARDRHTTWSDEVARDIQTFTREVWSGSG